MGALTSKIYSFEARPWELRKERGIDPFEGKEILFEMRGLTILRSFPREGWISDKIRIVLDAFSFNRLALPKRGVVEKRIHSWSRIFYFLFFHFEEERKRSKRRFFFPFVEELRMKEGCLLEAKRERVSFLVNRRREGRERKYD